MKPSDKRFDVYDATLKGFLIRVEPSGAKSYYVRYRLREGQRCMQKVGDAAVLTPDDARKEAKKILADVTKGGNPAAAKQAARAENLGQFIEGEYTKRWLLRLKSGGAKKWDSEGKSSGILRRLQACFKVDFWKRALDDPRLGFAVDNWITRRISKGTTRATVNKDVGALKAALNKAVEWGVISKNPLASIRPAKVDRARKVRYLTPEEEARLMAALDAHDEALRAGRDRFNTWRRERGYEEYPDLRKVPYAGNLAPMVILSLNTGLRRGEVFNLTWDDVDLESAMLTVQGDGAKSGTTRHVPLNSAAVAALKGWKASQPTPTGYVFPSRDGGRLDNVKKSWAVLLKAAKITAFRWHDMRHHFASRLVMAGVDLNTVRELLGHSDIKMTLRYAHLAPAVKAAAVERLVSATSNIVPLREASAERM